MKKKYSLSEWPLHVTCLNCGNIGFKYPKIYCSQICYIEHKKGKSLLVKHKRIHKIYKGIVQRTSNENNPAYPKYGGRGILLCKQWKNNSLAFVKWALKNGYQDDLSIDRINNSKGYSPKNCRWATRKQQSRNTSVNVIITHNGITKTATDWSLDLGECKTLVSSRINIGWDPITAITTKPKFKKHKLENK